MATPSRTPLLRVPAPVAALALALCTSFIASLALQPATANEADDADAELVSYMDARRAFEQSGALCYGIVYAAEGKFNGARVGELVSSSFTRATLDQIYAALAFDKEGRPPPAITTAGSEFTLGKTAGGVWNLIPKDTTNLIATRKVIILGGGSITYKQLPEMFNERRDSKIDLIIASDLEPYSTYDMRVALLPGEYTLPEVMNQFIAQNGLSHWHILHHCCVGKSKKEGENAWQLSDISYSIQIYVE